MKQKIATSLLFISVFFYCLPQPALSKKEDTKQRSSTHLKHSNSLSSNQFIPTTDRFAGGKSVVTLSHHSRDEGEQRYLRVVGEIKAGYSYPWSGIAYLPSGNYQKGVNLSQAHSLEFDAKTSQNTTTLSVLLFEQDNFIPFERTVKLTVQWARHRIKLSDFTNIDRSKISNISLVITETKGNFEFMINNITLINTKIIDNQ